jgi:hypothetical protein
LQRSLCALFLARASSSLGEGKTWTGFEALTACRKLLELSLHRQDLSATDVDDLSSLTTLCSLDLSRTTVYPTASLTSLSRLSSLTCLNLSNNSGLQKWFLKLESVTRHAELQALHLDSFLGAGPHAPHALSHLTALTQLTFISVKNCNLGSELDWMIPSIAHLTTLQHLDMTGGEIGPTSLTPLQGLPVLHLLELTLSMRTKSLLTKSSLRSLATLMGTAVKQLVVTLDCGQSRGRGHKHTAAVPANAKTVVNALCASGVNVTVRHKQ